ncbi:hypothetical protein GGR52DRAFT_573991 [Hypoxylon sp. FL1284]|nr:hypothetical protein GGR52DRAFT_573991 [Hypoxylon sp. FL1284]
MASLNLTEAEFRNLQLTAQRLRSINGDIEGMKSTIFQSNQPLPSLRNLQSHASIIEKHLGLIAAATSQHNELFSRIAVHPSTNFPGRTQEGILLQLLRKKPEPDVATAMEDGQKMVTGHPHSDEPNKEKTVDGSKEAVAEGPEKDLEDIWAKTRETFFTRMLEYGRKEARLPFTEQEYADGLANVRTGLRKGLDWEEEANEDEEEDEEEEGDDDVMEIDRPPPPPAPAVAAQQVEGAPLESVMRFAARGEFVAG